MSKIVYFVIAIFFNIYANSSFAATAGDINITGKIPLKCELIIIAPITFDISTDIDTRYEANNFGTIICNTIFNAYTSLGQNNQNDIFNLRKENTNELIPYSFIIFKKNYDDSNALSIAGVHKTHTPIYNELYLNMKIFINKDDAQNKPAGLYKDTIKLTIAPQ